MPKEVITMIDGMHEIAEDKWTVKMLYISLFVVLLLAADGMMMFGILTLAAAVMP